MTGRLILSARYDCWLIPRNEEFVIRFVFIWRKSNEWKGCSVVCLSGTPHFHQVENTTDHVYIKPDSGYWTRT